MHAMASRRFEDAAPADFHLQPPIVLDVPAPRSAYRSDAGSNWTAIAAVAAMHAAALAALVMFDVVALPGPASEPTVVTLMPLPIVPAPPVQNASEPLRRAKPLAPAPSPVVAPPPIVAVPARAAPALVAVPAPPPPVASAAPTVVSTAAAQPAAPVTPPDASAATLGNAPPKYPLEARRKRQEGVVRLRVVITAEGRVKEISVARSSGFETLDDAALAAVRKWRFRPGEQAGTPVEAVGYLSIPFALRD